MRKKKDIIKSFKIFCPDSSGDIEDIISILLERECSILVNMSKLKIKQSVITKIIDFISSYQTSYIIIKVKKVYPKVFVCWSEHPKQIF